MASLWSVTVKGLMTPGSRGGQGSVVQEKGTQGQDADSSEGGRDEDGEDSEGEDLPAHVLPLLLAVLDAVVQEHGAQGSLHRRLRHPRKRHEDLLLVVEAAAGNGEICSNHRDV